MGRIIKILSKKKIRKSCDLLPSRLITERNKGEPFHFHLRNLRLELSKEEFTQLTKHLSESYTKYKKNGGILKDDGRDGQMDSYFVLDKKKIKKFAESNPEKLQIELNHPKNIHVHLRDLRLEFSIREFLEIADLFEEAKHKLKEGESKIIPLKAKYSLLVNIRKIGSKLSKLKFFRKLRKILKKRLQS